MGLRDYAMFLLIATYGLRASEVVAITLDDIHWREGILRIHQRKTSSPLELPLTNEVLSALVKHLKRTPPPAPYRRVFMRMRAPMGVLKPTRGHGGLSGAGSQKRAQHSPPKAHIVCATRTPCVSSKGELPLRPSVTSWGIVPQRATSHVPAIGHWGSA